MGWPVCNSTLTDMKSRSLYFHIVYSLNQMLMRNSGWEAYLGHVPDHFSWASFIHRIGLYDTCSSPLVLSNSHANHTPSTSEWTKSVSYLLHSTKSIMHSTYFRIMRILLMVPVYATSNLLAIYFLPCYILVLARECVRRDRPGLILSTSRKLCWTRPACSEGTLPNNQGQAKGLATVLVPTMYWRRKWAFTCSTKWSDFLQRPKPNHHQEIS